jgi:hypothetical protein
MKTDFCVFLIIFALLLSGCTYDKLPPKTDSSSSQYVLPKGEVPSEADREALAAIRAEYESYITNE